MWARNKQAVRHLATSLELDTKKGYASLDILLREFDPQEGEIDCIDSDIMRANASIRIKVSCL